MNDIPVSSPHQIPKSTPIENLIYQFDGMTMVVTWPRRPCYIGVAGGGREWSLNDIERLPKVFHFIITMITSAMDHGARHFKIWHFTTIELPKCRELELQGLKLPDERCVA